MVLKRKGERKSPLLSAARAEMSLGHFADSGFNCIFGEMWRETSKSVFFVVVVHSWTFGGATLDLLVKSCLSFVFCLWGS